MKFKDYYDTLAVARDASASDIKAAYRKLARKFHPDVSKEPNAEARFKEIGEAYEVLKDPDKRAAYDAIGQRRGDDDFTPPPDWDAAHAFHGNGAGPAGHGAQDHSEFFDALFGRAGRAGTGAHATGERRGAGINLRGEDHHARVRIDLEDAFTGARRSLTLQMPEFDEQGRGVLRQRTLDVAIPKGIRQGQHLRLAGQGGPGLGTGAAGDLYLEIEFKPHPRWRVDGRDIYLDLPVAPWEAALGGAAAIPTPTGTIELKLPAGSTAGRKLRVKGKGIPGNPDGDLYAVLAIVLPAADNDARRQAYEALKAAAGPSFNPRSST